MGILALLEDRWFVVDFVEAPNKMMMSFPFFLCSSLCSILKGSTSPFPFFFISMQTSQNHKSQTLLCVNQCIYDVCTNKSSHMFPFLFRSLCALFSQRLYPTFPFFIYAGFTKPQVTTLLACVVLAVFQNKSTTLELVHCSFA